MTEAVCIASGPSLTVDDCDAVRAWRDSCPGRFVVVTNNTYQICTWSDYLYAMDNEWWRLYAGDVQKVFRGKSFSRYGNYGSRKTPVFHGDNSGAGAILLADYFNAGRILLLGYDCQHTHNMTHWHGNHKKPLGNTQSMQHWPRFFQNVADNISADVINITRNTALDVWATGRLEDELY